MSIVKTKSGLNIHREQHAEITNKKHESIIIPSRSEEHTSELQSH